MTDCNVRTQGLKAFYANLGGNHELSLICGDASNRKFYRVPEGILMDAPCSTEKNHEFVDIANRLATANILAPKVLAVDYDNGYLLVTDLGKVSFSDLVQRANSEVMIALYKRAIDTMVCLSHLDCQNLPKYDEAFIKREDDICRDYYFKAHNILLTPAEADVLSQAEQVWIASDLQAPQIAMHRDFHSRNLMMPSGQVALIDFQDMVLGPIGYDLASLLRDCYIELPKKIYSQVLNYAFTKYNEFFLHDLLTFSEFERIVDLAGLQRHIKCLGIFNRLAIRDGKKRYLENIPLVEKYVVDVASKYSEFDDLVKIIKKYALSFKE